MIEEWLSRRRLSGLTDGGEEAEEEGGTGVSEAEGGDDDDGVDDDVVSAHGEHCEGEELDTEEAAPGAVGVVELASHDFHCSCSALNFTRSVSRTYKGRKIR